MSPSGHVEPCYFCAAVASFLLPTFYGTDDERIYAENDDNWRNSQDSFARRNGRISIAATTALKSAAGSMPREIWFTRKLYLDGRNALVYVTMEMYDRRRGHPLTIIFIDFNRERLLRSRRILKLTWRTTINAGKGIVSRFVKWIRDLVNCSMASLSKKKRCPPKDSWSEFVECSVFFWKRKASA